MAARPDTPEEVTACDKDLNTATGDKAVDENKDTFECGDGYCAMDNRRRSSTRSRSNSSRRRFSAGHSGSMEYPASMERQNSCKSLSGERRTSREEEEQSLSRHASGTSRKNSVGCCSVMVRCEGDQQWYAMVRRRSAVRRLFTSDGITVSSDSEMDCEPVPTYCLQYMRLASICWLRIILAVLRMQVWCYAAILCYFDIKSLFVFFSLLLQSTLNCFLADELAATPWEM